jgi:diguanylate cyclase (GGDEF)-like protein
MTQTLDAGITPEDVEVAREQVRRATHGLIFGLQATLVVAAAAGGAVAALITGAEPVLGLALLTGLAALVLSSPIIVGINLVARRRGFAMGVAHARQARIMQFEADRRAFENQLGRGLEMAEDEDSAFDVIRRAVTMKLPAGTVELLLADNSHAHLGRAVTTQSEAGGPAGCPVDAPDQCIAARRAHTSVFPDSEHLDACPFLRERGPTSCTAVCVPVSIMGRTVGIAHAVRAAERPFLDAEVQALQSIANQAGNRLGVLRIMSETQLQASTDGLTGLTNRRSFENHARRLRTEGSEFVLVMADLDHFKDLNDTYGHEAGDRALRLFSQVLRGSVRDGDVVCRYGGEEFVLMLTDTDVPEAVEVVERTRAALAAAIARDVAPAFTASFGLAASGDAADLEDLLRRADQALFAAKDAGRDCVCMDGHHQPISSLAAFS